MGDEAWLAAVRQKLGAPVRIVRRAASTGGYVASSVERVDLDVGGRPMPVVLKGAGPV